MLNRAINIKDISSTPKSKFTVLSSEVTKCMVMQSEDNLSYSLRNAPPPWRSFFRKFSLKGKNLAISKVIVVKDVLSIKYRNLLTCSPK